MSTKIFLKWPLIIGIAIVLNLFFAYAIKVIYPGQDYEDFCPQQQKIERIATSEQCLEKGGQWDGSYITPEETGYCNQNFKCEQEYQAFLTVYEKNVFIILVVLGVIVFGMSFLTGINQVLATAFSFGGVLTFIVASIRYWELAEDWLHLLILALALVALIWLGVKKFKDIEAK